MYYPLEKDYDSGGCVPTTLNSIKYDERYTKLDIPISLYDVQAYSGVN